MPTGAWRRTSSAYRKSFFPNTGTQPAPELRPRTTDYHETSLLFSDISSIGSPSFPGYDPSPSPLGSANLPTVVKFISSAGPASPSIAVANVDAASLFPNSVNSPVAGPDFSPSVNSLIDLNLGRSVGAASSFTNMMSVLRQPLLGSKLRLDRNNSLNNSAQRVELQQHQDVDRPGSPPGRTHLSTYHDFLNPSRHLAMSLNSSYFKPCATRRGFRQPQALKVYRDFIRKANPNIHEFIIGVSLDELPKHFVSPPWFSLVCIIVPCWTLPLIVSVLIIPSRSVK